jgi:hypothetical protein
MSAIGADEKVKLDFDLDGACFVVVFLLYLEPGSFVFEIGTGELVVKEKFDVGHGFKLIQESLVKASAVDGTDGLLKKRTGDSCR